MKVIQGDCLTVLPTLAADGLDACVTDPQEPESHGIATARLAHALKVEAVQWMRA